MKAILQKVKYFIFLLLFPITLFSQSNQYLHFDKVDDWVRLSNGSQYVVNSTGISITGWFYTDALAYGQGMMGFRSGGQGFYMIILNNGVIECRLNGTNGLFEYVAPANTIIPQMWQHFAWIYNGSNITLYVNGFLKGSTPASGLITDNTVPFAVGKSPVGTYTFYYGGRADEVSVWSKALTQVEIQDMIANELTGQEPDLEMYYKFNQGVPGGNNTSITHLVSEVGAGTRDAELLNFALSGATSNFNGTLNAGYQAISFPQIPNKLTTSPPFHIDASATSGLPVFFEVVSGPATLANDTLYLTGIAGEVVIKATQPGNAQFDTAAPVVNSFMVVDPAVNVPDIDVRHPLAGNVYVPVLKKIQLAAISAISYPELFSVQSLQFEVDGVTIPSQGFADGHFTAWWTPPAYGNYTLSVISTNNFGYAATENVSFAVVQDTIDMDVVAADSIWLNTDINTVVVDAELPSFLGSFDQITATLQVSCPPTGGCGEWDRVASIDARGHDGKWFEIIRYITPYGVPCSHNIDLTDYMSLLNGKVTFRLNCGTLDNGYLYKLTLHYKAGLPAHCYSTVNEIWNEIYPFGDLADLQPVEDANFSYPDNAVASKLKLVSTGHGWGATNTGNAAEFYSATHHIWVNGAETFEQFNWYDCDPNPDGCSPQSGTWKYNRAGWCPGAIAQWFNYTMDPFIAGQDIVLKYVFYPDYVDQCHPNNPACVTGVTCSNCADGFNPVLDVACNLVVFADEPIVNGINNRLTSNEFKVYPNPTHDILNITANKAGTFRSSAISIFTPEGNVVSQFGWNGENTGIDLSNYPKGIYFLKVISPEGIGLKKFILL